MSKVTLVTVSDDRFGRKEGQYAATQVSIYNMLRSSGLRIDAYQMATWKDIEGTQFYKDNSILLQNKDAARNGRAYKPYVISEALKSVNDGDFVIYTDCSPEMWSSVDFSYTFDIDVIKDLCSRNNGILSAFVRWDTRSIAFGKLGIHTHANFTTDRCIIKMGARQWEKSFMHASGMIVLQKNSISMQFMEEWLYFNLDPDCCALGNPNVSDDYSFWDDYEARYKMGHRHDQSISGILLNFLNPKLVDPPPSTFHPYNFLNFCRLGYTYEFIDSNYNPEPTRLRKGEDVKNKAGEVIRVFEIWPSPKGEILIVGKHRESAYQTTEQEIIRL